MKNLLLVIFLLVASSVPVNAQVTFRADTSLCETIPWKLVWYDEFDGTAIDTNKWFTFSDDNNWASNGTIHIPPVNVEGRRGNMVIFRDANVTVSNGTCKLAAKYEPNEFLGARRNFTSGYIKARVNDNGPKLQYFNRGRFEIRAKLPKVKNVWATFWLWVGGVSAEGAGGTEIDMFEYMPNSKGKLNTNTFTLHGWNRGPGWPVSPSSTADRETFKVDNIDSWHVYACEWDENFVRLYLDGVLQFTKSRYKLSEGRGRYRNTNSCTPVPGAKYYKDPAVTATFPFPDELLSLVCSMDYRSELKWVAGEPTRAFEIDYVRVYQRTPQWKLKDVCTTITGPGSIRLDVPATYYASIGEGTFVNWTVSDNIQILSSGITAEGKPFVTVKAIAGGSSRIAVKVQGRPYGCPDPEIRVNAGT